MIQEIKVSNFLSFKEPTTFSFEATKDTFAEDYQVVKINDTVRLLRFAVVYGYNASGKSNLIRVISFLRYFLNQKIKGKSKDDETSVIPFLLDNESRNEPSTFDILFWIDSVKYLYKLSIDSKEVKEESLYYYPGIQPKKIFVRKSEDGLTTIDFNNDLELSAVVKEQIIVNCIRNISVFSARNQVNAKIPLIDDAWKWFSENIINIIGGDVDIDEIVKDAEDEIENNEAFKSYALDFVHAADFNISDISVKTEEHEITPEMIDKISKSMIPNEIKNKLISEKKLSSREAVFYYSVRADINNDASTFKLSEYLQSLGTKKMLGVEFLIYKLLNSGGIVVIDEIENSLHPKLVEKILFEYLKNNSRTQLLVTTHNDGLLDLTDDLFRKDSVWFAEKKDNGATDLYRLTDFRGLNRISSIREAYRNKRFGATMR